MAFCTKCGYNISNDARFCDHCGARIETPVIQPVHQTPYVQPAGSQYHPPNEPSYVQPNVPPSVSPGESPYIHETSTPSSYTQPINVPYNPPVNTSPYTLNNTIPPYMQPKKRKTAVLWLAIGLPVLALLIGIGLVVAGFISELNHPIGVTVVPTIHATALPTRSQTPKPIPTSTPLPTQAATAPAEVLPGITADDIVYYFSQIALKAEYGDNSYDGIVKKWDQPIKVAVHGDYTQQDYNTLALHMDMLNEIAGMPEITMDQENANYNVYFTELDKLKDVIPSYVENNWGYISLFWDGNCAITEATMGIATDVTNQTQRNHLILEEFTQGLGLLNDTADYPDSIFQMEWTETQQLSDLDFWIIALLYSPDIYPGMTSDKSLPVLRTLLAS